jgi:hypothetical protein
MPPRQSQTAAPTRQQNTSPAVARGPASPAQPVVRGAAPEEPARPVRLAMPTPERLGIGQPAPRPAGLDWPKVGRRLQELGATGCHLDPQAGGGYRFTCWLPGERPGVQRRIEASGATQAEAAQLALERAGQQGQRRP